jgi:hypothetical protein
LLNERSRVAAERRPNLFIVGAQKSGTTTLAFMLDTHPDIFMCRPKEPGYLAFETAGYTFQNGYGEIAAAADWVVRDREAYLALFAAAPPGARYRGEASTWYLSEQGTAERIRSFSDDARIIVILRHPAERAYSAWCHARRDREEPCANFAAALAAEAQRLSPAHLLRYREMGLYARQLRAYLEQFGAERVLILRYDELRDDPDGLWRRCLAFLDLDDGLPAPAAHRQNRSGMPRSRLLHRLLKHQGFKERMRRWLPGSLAARAKVRADRLNLRQFPPMPAQQREELIEFFTPEVRELEGLTGLDLSAWRRP